jgi:hypothetical protein
VGAADFGLHIRVHRQLFIEGITGDRDGRAVLRVQELLMEWRKTLDAQEEHEGDPGLARVHPLHAAGEGDPGLARVYPGTSLNAAELAAAWGGPERGYPLLTGT